MIRRNISPDAVLTLFFRRPLLGVGKQRLAAGIGRENALRVAELLLECALEDMAAWPGVLVFAVADKVDNLWAQQLLNQRFIGRTCHLVNQPNGNIGQRLNCIDTRLRRMRYSEIYYIGSDAPLLHSGIFSASANALATSDVALASSEDGGVTLMASKQGWPDIRHLPWSTDKLGQSLENSCLEAGHSVATVGGLYDVDTLDDLNRALIDLVTDPRQSRQTFCRETSLILNSLEVEAA